MSDPAMVSWSCEPGRRLAAVADRGRPGWNRSAGDETIGSLDADGRGGAPGGRGGRGRVGGGGGPGASTMGGGGGGWRRRVAADRPGAYGRRGWPRRSHSGCRWWGWPRSRPRKATATIIGTGSPPRARSMRARRRPVSSPPGRRPSPPTRAWSGSASNCCSATSLSGCFPRRCRHAEAGRRGRPCAAQPASTNDDPRMAIPGAAAPDLLNPGPASRLPRGDPASVRALARPCFDLPVLRFARASICPCFDAPCFDAPVR